MASTLYKPHGCSASMKRCNGKDHADDPTSEAYCVQVQMESICSIHRSTLVGLCLFKFSCLQSESVPLQ